MKKFVGYYRVSTARQGVSGLGLQAQVETVKSYIGNNLLIKEFTEIESGGNNKRVELEKAIEYAKDNNATLIIAKLDRLSRNVSFIFQLRDSGVDFICCDIPNANTMTIGVYALVAQQERELISKRTKDALQVKKSQGFQLGTPENLDDVARMKGVSARQEIAKTNENNKRAFALIKSLKMQKMGLRTIASELNNSGYKTSTGKNFYPMSVKQLYTFFTVNS